jgi:hypothetical protein
VDELDKLERAEVKSRVFSEFAERFQYFTGFALLFLVLEFLIRYPEKQAPDAHESF